MVYSVYSSNISSRFTLEIKGYQTTHTQQTNKNSRVETGIRNELMRLKGERKIDLYSSDGHKLR